MADIKLIEVCCTEGRIWDITKVCCTPKLINERLIGPVGEQLSLYSLLLDINEQICWCKEQQPYVSESSLKLFCTTETAIGAQRKERELMQLKYSLCNFTDVRNKGNKLWLAESEKLSSLKCYAMNWDRSL